MISKVFTQLIKRKFVSGITLLIIAGGGYYGYTKVFSDDGVVRYATAQIQKGTLIVSITGSGQVSASNQMDVKAKASGDIIYVGVKNGQEVKAGLLLVQLDARDAQKSVRDAEVNFQQVKLDLEKMKGIATDVAILRGVKEKADDNLEKDYEDGFNAVANAFLELPGIISGLRDLLFSTSVFGSNQENIDYYAGSVKSYDEKVAQYRDEAWRTYLAAKAAYDKDFENYKEASRFSGRSTIEALIGDTYETTKDIAEAVKNANNLVQFYKDKLIERNLKPNAIADTHLASLNAYTGKTNTYLSNLLSTKNTIQADKEALIGTDLDIADQEIRVSQAKNSLDDAKEKLADYFIRAPFDGIIAKFNVKKGDSASSGTAVATLVTRQNVAEISLNEVDVIKIKAGQKVTLTFEAIPDFMLTGQVAEVDAVGTVSQGVVTYAVKIGFDTQDDRVKTAMSVSAAIVTEAKPNVLIVPNSAVKSQGRMSYVEIVDGDDKNLALAANASGAVLENSPRQQPVEIGTVSDDFTEITGGLKEGDVIIIRTFQSTSAQTAQTQQNSSVRIPGLPGGGGGGGGFRGGGGAGR